MAKLRVRLKAQRHTLTTHVTSEEVLTNENVLTIRMGQYWLYCIGTIEYWDDAGRARQTAFCRHLRFEEIPPRPSDQGRFEKVDDPDYEYQD